VNPKIQVPARPEAHGALTKEGVDVDGTGVEVGKEPLAFPGQKPHAQFSTKHQPVGLP
jgi:hypothetical protein